MFFFLEFVTYKVSIYVCINVFRNIPRMLFVKGCPNFSVQLTVDVFSFASAGVTHPERIDYRCEQTLFNAPGEALALTDAARLFLSSEKENRALQAPGFDEHLQAALNCYSFAIKVHMMISSFLF